MVKFDKNINNRMEKRSMTQTENAVVVTDVDLARRMESIKQNTKTEGMRLTGIKQDASTATTNMTTATGFTNASGLPLGGYHVLVGELFQRVYPALVSQHIFANIVTDKPFAIVAARRKIYNYSLLNGVKLADVIKARKNPDAAAQLGMTPDEINNIVAAYEMGAFDVAWNGGDATAGYSGGYGNITDGLDPALGGQSQLAWNLVMDDVMAAASVAQANKAASKAAGGTVALAQAPILPLQILNAVNYIATFPTRSQGETALDDEADSDEFLGVGSTGVQGTLVNTFLDPIDIHAIIEAIATGTGTAGVVTWKDVLAVLEAAYAGSLRPVVGVGSNIFKAEAWKFTYEPFFRRAAVNDLAGATAEAGVRWPAQGLAPVAAVDPTAPASDDNQNAVFRDDAFVKALGFANDYVIKSDVMPEIAIIYDSEDVRLMARKLGASFTIEELSFAQSLYGIDEKASAMEVIVEEIRQNQDREAIALAKKLAVDFAKGGGVCLEVDLNDTSTLPGSSLGSDGNAVINFNSIENRVMKLANNLIFAVQTVQRKTRMVKGGGILTTAQVISGLQATAGYFTTISNIKGSDIDTSSNGDCLAGYINGNIPVYLDQFANEDYALAFVKGSGQNAGIIRVDYNTQASFETVDPVSGAQRLCLMQWYGYATNLLSAGNYFRLVKFRNLSMINGNRYNRGLGW